MLKPLLVLLAVVFAAPFAARAAIANPGITIEKTSGVGIIRGVVRDDGGSPIADATVAIFRGGTSHLLKQVSSASDGSFLAKILPGTYTVLAVAQGFNPVYRSVEVNRSSDLNRDFNLERAGGGNTLPEKRPDRNSSKWHLRAAQMNRAIYQHQEGRPPVSETATNKTDADADPAVSADLDTQPGKKPGQSVVETYFAGTKTGNYSGVNFATLMPVTDNSVVVIAGQTGKGKNAPQRLETDFKFRPSDKHQLSLNASIARLGTVTNQNGERPLGQVSVQSTDEWKLREGVILVFGFDYSRFLGSSDDFSLSPRLGLQFDIDSKTRFRTSLTTQTEEKTWAQAVDMEGTSVLFSEPVSVDDLVVMSGKPQMNKSRRLEFGIERVLDNRSSIEANTFFDTTLGRGVGLNAFSFDTLGGDGFAGFVSNQQGRLQGVRVVYSRRLDNIFSASAGYAAGSGQRLSANAFSDPSKVFETDFFQSFFAQVAADLKTGTSVRTIFRLSPQATVFAIDPFKGRLAIYDPGLSIFVTQTLPTFGLPVHAEAVVDARNLFDFQTGISNELGSFKVSSQGRAVRGGILVRF